MPGDGVTITGVRFRNYKTFSDYRLDLRQMNLLVGPNNSGKSTIIGAFRILAAGLRTAKAKSAERLDVGRTTAMGYRLSSAVIPESTENVHYDYGDVPATVDFRLSNGNQLALRFEPGGDECLLLPEVIDREVRSPAAFAKAFPISLGVVPVLGPVEHNEKLVEPQTVKSFLTTRRASRHFRSYWFHFPEEFEAFRSRIRATWSDMDIQRPERENPYEPRLLMMCVESGQHRELYWAGFGFQVWCQLMTHLLRADETTVVVIDEPEIYLHPDLQRHLLTTLRDLGPDVLLATHSSEIVAMADPPDVVIVDKQDTRARRVGTAQGVQAAFHALGSSQNVVLSRLARTRRVLFVEGGDYKYLGRFARRLGLNDLAAEAGLTVFAVGHFPELDEVLAIRRGMEEALGLKVLAACIFDRDYRSKQEVEKILRSLAPMTMAVLTERKEIENYLLVPDVLDRALGAAARDQSRRTGSPVVELQSAAEVLEEITDPMKHEVLGAWAGEEVKTQRTSGTDPATTLAGAMPVLEQRWDDLDERMHLIPGKTVLGKFLTHYQANFGINLTPASIVGTFRPNEIALDLAAFLRNLDAVRRSKAPKS